MIGYTLLGANDYDKACAFYDNLMGEVGAKRAMDFGSAVLYANNPAGPLFGVCKPYDGQAATRGNGTMIALNMPSREKVDAFHAKALSLGGSDEGAPGQRSDGFYAGYFRDLDGNKLCAFYTGA